MINKLKTYFIRTYGCAMNVADSERIAGWYEERGWKLAKNINEADEVVINTCSVRQSAEDRVFGLINNLVKLKVQSARLQTTCNVGQAKFKVAVQSSKLRRHRIILTGCMLRYPLRWLKEKLPSVDEFIKSSKFKVQSSKLHIRSSETQAFVPIMEGCNNFCSYCVVPYARGREVSRPFAEIVCEVEELAKRGYKEIMLLGQNVNSYGKDFGKATERHSNIATKKKISEALVLCSFAALIHRLHQTPGIEKIFFLSSNPWGLDDEIIEAMSLPKIDKYLHLPVQSGDNEILKKMNRKYTANDYLKLVGKIRKKIPEIKIGTDIIVGFPTETEEQFQHTVDLCKKIGFEKAYVARYSPRLQTAAYQMKDDIPHKEKERRWKILDRLINH